MRAAYKGKHVGRSHPMRRRRAVTGARMFRFALAMVLGVALVPLRGYSASAQDDSETDIATIGEPQEETGDSQPQDASYEDSETSSEPTDNPASILSDYTLLPASDDGDGENENGTLSTISDSELKQIISQLSNWTITIADYANTITFSFIIKSPEKDGDVSPSDYTLTCVLDDTVTSLGKNLGDNATVEVANDDAGKPTCVRYTVEDTNAYNMEFDLSKVKFTITRASDGVSASALSDGTAIKLPEESRTFDWNKDKTPPKPTAYAWDNSGLPFESARYYKAGTDVGVQITLTDYADSGFSASGIDGNTVKLTDEEGTELSSCALCKSKYVDFTEYGVVTLSVEESAAEESAALSIDLSEIYIYCEDNAGNPMQQREALSKYLSCSSIVIDTTSPTVSWETVDESEIDTYLNSGGAIKITLNDDYLSVLLKDGDSDTVVATINDSTGTVTESICLKDFDETGEAFVSASEIPDGVYTVKYNKELTDYVGNPVVASDWSEEGFVIDKTAPTVKATYITETSADNQIAPTFQYEGDISAQKVWFYAKQHGLAFLQVKIDDGENGCGVDSDNVKVSGDLNSAYQSLDYNTKDRCWYLSFAAQKNGEELSGNDGEIDPSNTLPKIEVTDRIGNKGKVQVSIGEGPAPDLIVIDNTPPSAEFKASNYANENDASPYYYGTDIIDNDSGEVGKIEISDENLYYLVQAVKGGSAPDQTVATVTLKGASESTVSVSLKDLDISSSTQVTGSAPLKLKGAIEGTYTVSLLAIKDLAGNVKAAKNNVAQLVVYKEPVKINFSSSNSVVCGGKTYLDKSEGTASITLSDRYMSKLFEKDSEELGLMSVCRISGTSSSGEPIDKTITLQDVDTNGIANGQVVLTLEMDNNSAAPISISENLIKVPEGEYTVDFSPAYSKSSGIVDYFNNKTEKEDVPSVQTLVFDKTNPSASSNIFGDITDESTTNKVGDRYYLANKNDKDEDISRTIVFTVFDANLKAASVHAGESGNGDPVVLELTGPTPVTIWLSDLSSDKFTDKYTVKLEEGGAKATVTLNLAGKNRWNYLFDEGDYTATYMPGNVKDLSNNSCDGIQETVDFSIDRVAPTVAWDSALTGNYSSDSVCYLENGAASTVTVTVEDANLDDMLASNATKGQPALKVVGANGTEKTYTLERLAATDQGEAIQCNSNDGKKLETTITLSSDIFGEGYYTVTLLPDGQDGFKDLTGIETTSNSASQNYVIDRTAPELSVVIYGAYGDNGVTDMQTVFDGTFFYRFGSGQRFVFLQTSDPYSRHAGEASGLTSVVKTKGESVTDLDKQMPSYERTYEERVYQVGNAEGMVRLAFNSQTEIGTNAIAVTVTDNCGNRQEYTLSGDNGKVTAYKSGTAVSDPSTLVNDTAAPTAGIDFLGLSGYYASAQSGSVSVSDNFLDYLVAYAERYGDSAYNAVAATVYATDNGGNTSTQTLRMADFLSGLSGGSSSFGYAWDNDADYRIEFTPNNIVDLSDNQCVSEAHTVEFTVDNIDPSINVSWDNNDVRNGKYYKASRTATITVNEHNFDSSRVTINAQGGSVGSWSSNGDTHTVQVYFGSDATCNLSVEMTDLAGRAASWTGEEFVVDLTTPTIYISGVENEHAYNGTVAPIISFWDEANFDFGTSAITYTLVGNKVGEVYYSVSRSNEDNGATITFADFEHLITVDDIYTLTAKVVDLAGNEYSTSVTFSVNRFGSNFIVDAPTTSQRVNAQSSDPYDFGYQNTPPTIVIREINVDPIDAAQSSVAVTYNLETTSLNAVDTIDTAGFTFAQIQDGTGWSEATYTISNKSFVGTSNGSTDGSYLVELSSVDGAGNHNTTSQYWTQTQSDDGSVVEQEKSCVVKFILDTSAPEIYGVSVSDGGVYFNSGNYEATFNVSDNIALAEDTLAVTIKGTPANAEIIDKASGQYAVEIPQGIVDLDQSLDITVQDLAENTANHGSKFADILWPALVVLAAAIAFGGGIVIGMKHKKKREQFDVE